jgi:hypothetical protein
MLTHFFRLFGPNDCPSVFFCTNHNPLDISPPHTLPFFVGLGALPPSLPIHCERERSRWKKSRPPGVGGNVIEVGLLTRVRNIEEPER